MFLLINSFKKIIKTNKTVYFIHIVFFIVFILPILLDYIIGVPQYKSNYIGFNFSKEDYLTRVIYSTYILIIQFIILYIGKKSNEIKDNSIKIFSCKSKIINILLFLAASSTCVLVLIFPVPKEILFQFGWRDSESIVFSQNALKYYSTLERFSFISISAAILFIGYNKWNNILLKIFMALLLYMSICVQSKRTIMALIAVSILAHLLFNSKKKNRKKILIIGFILFLLLIYYSIYIKTEFRNYSTLEMLYTTMRIDFGRDDTLKLVIYSFLNPDRINILDYFGQSFITQLGSIFPLSFLGVKTIGYNAFLTAGLIDMPLDPTINFMTTSIFDEFLANFGIIGFWIAPYIIGKLCVLADNQNKRLKSLTVSMILLLMMLPISFIMWFIQFWALMIFAEFKLQRLKLY